MTESTNLSNLPTSHYSDLSDSSFNASYILDYSSGSVEQNELINSLQEKAGELLKANENIYNYKKQITALESTILQNNENHENEKKFLQDRIEENKSTINTLNDQIDNLHDELNKRTDEIINLKGTKESEAETNKEMLKQQQHSFQMKVDSLQTENNDLKDENSQLREEIRLLKQNSTVMENETRKIKLLNQSLTDEKGESEKMNASYRKLINDFKIEKTEAENNFQRLLTASKRLRAEIESNKQTIDAKQREINDISEKLTSVQELLPEYTRFDELIEQLRDKISLAESLPIELKKMNKERRKAIKAAKVYNSKYETMKSQLNEAEERTKIAEKNSAATSKENEEITNKYNFIKAWKDNVKAIEKTNSVFSKYLSEINGTLKGNNTPHTLRSLLVTSVLLNRWKKVCGTEKKYETDTRNWWWICTPNGMEHIHSETMNSIRDLQTVKSVLDKKIEQLNGSLEQNKEENRKIAEILDQKESENQQLKREKQGNEMKLEALSSEIRSRITEDEKMDLEEELNESKCTIRKLEKALSASTEQMVYLKHEISILRQRELTRRDTPAPVEKKVVKKVAAEPEKRKVKEEKKNEPFYIEKEDKRPQLSLHQDENNESNKLLFQKLSLMSRNFV